ncbi:hypothetical protein OHA_2_00094 (plasmid) [Pleomorphomonas sp. SM30]|uniref:Nucleotidyltransferase AbiEii toxin of type IV toxin-antitoxin system n=2 Tax=Oharaeibacter diazotrophicus TaxID=1920512 RepID=A0A4R6R5U5_9HYPH|nr:nucleotidyltransferase AbiEii toxin of type IV toxin-antitoxin system [Oharaeibacter diazotrophicus]BBE74892.1 hypothetical protein OHA_2_00094 [Pleomorphomonas sp. SM30]GLS75603.1 hypothetical protein GCM10007904_09380 [Oharaeibacter diazotrophicus]
MAMNFVRPEHTLIAEVLASMDAQWLLDNHCFFAGGTAIVLANGEYRRSLDVDFLCDDVDGYRTLRTAAIGRGAPAFFRIEVETLRAFRADQYGIRAVIGWKGQPVRFEIVREARIPLGGSPNAMLRVPVLDLHDQFAEKLLANADRCLDPAFAYRDAIDLGRLCMANGGRIPDAAVEKATRAYGTEIPRKVASVVGILAEEKELRRAAAVLLMDFDVARRAVSAFRHAAAAAWPDLELADVHPTAIPRDP